MNTQFTGLGVALVTPFTAEEKVDVAALRWLVNHLIDNGVDFLVPLGTTGESATLSTDEQYTVLEAVLEANDGRKPVMIGCGGNNTHAVAQKLEALTSRYHPDGFLSVSPYYNKPTQAGIVAHYKTIAAATDRPIILYNVPGRTASNLTAATVVEIANACPNVKGIKEASGDLEQGMAILRDRPEGFLVLSGDDSLALPQIACGYEGVISVVGNVLPRPYADLIHAALAGRLADARRIQLNLLELMKLNFAEGNPAGAKCAMSLLGLCGPGVRLPLVPATDDLRERMRLALQKAGFLVGANRLHEGA